jgi:protein phosphatase PTC7
MRGHATQGNNPESPAHAPACAHSDASDECNACCIPLLSLHPRHTPVCRLLPESKLEVLNLGDSGMRLIRGGQIVFATDVLQHQFNMPYQLGNTALLPETDTPADAAVATPSVQHGDVIVMGSDGFFDNVWDEDLTRLVQTKTGSGRELAEADTMSLAKALVSFAASKSRDQSYRSPWSVECAQNRNTGLMRKFFPKGGKVDDITVVVAQLQS